MIEVTQQDRDAAAQEALYQGLISGRQSNEIRAGRNDRYWFVQAFAAHRIAAETALAAKLVAWMRGRIVLADGRAIPQACRLALATAIKRGEHRATKDNT